MLSIKSEQSLSNDSAVIEKEPAELKKKSPKYKMNDKGHTGRVPVPCITLTTSSQLPETFVVVIALLTVAFF